MVSLKVIDTDNFLALPESARLLYYDLAVRADDDGFIDNPKKVINFTGSSENALKILCDKQYLIPFDTGVCVIRHWHVHNLIRNDRYVETEYRTEKAALVEINRKYELRANVAENTKDVIPTGNQLATQVRIGEVNKNILCDKSHDTQVFFNGFEIKEPIFDMYTDKFPYEDYQQIRDLPAPKSGKALERLAKVVLYHFNWVTRSRFRPVPANLAMIKNCLATGVTLGDCFAVNSIKQKQWTNDPDMQKYIRIKTLYAGKNFEQYLGEVKTQQFKQNGR